MTRILIVEDEEPIRQALRRVLERQHHQVAEAGDVAEARRRLAGESYDLLLCDINLPGESGLDLVRQVAAELPDTAVVMVTGVDDPEVAEEALAMGAYGYLVKPFLPNEILINVSSALRRRELERARRSHLEEMEGKMVARASALRGAFKRLDESETTTRLAEQETVDRLVTALTLRSEETGGHIQRMSRYAAALAVKRGVKAWSEGEFRLAAMLHDVGKIGVPDSILLKPGPLTEAEFEIIKRHPDMGASLLADGLSRVMLLGARIALTHHERWDGAGYPAGLTGDAIPIEGRIAAIADVYDALTSERVYRTATAPDQALEAMLANRGRHFDPELVDLFAASMDEVLDIHRAYADPPPAEGEITVLVVDARRMFADAVVRYLNDADGITVVGSAATAAEAQAMAAERPPDVVVVDAELPDGEGVDLAVRIKADRPGTAVILLAARDDERLLVRALDAGCAGVVLHDRAFDELGTAVPAAHAGEPLVPPARLLSLLTRHRSGSDGLELTSREMEVLSLMAEGLSNAAVARRLNLSLNTIRNHTQRILNKLGAHSRLGAVAEASRRGQLPPRP